MLPKFKWLAGICAALFLTPAPAANNIYHCQPHTVDNDARLVAYPDADVSTYSEPNKKICNFSLDGATASGPSRPNQKTNWKDIIAQIESANLNVLVIKLTAARQDFDDKVQEFREKAKEFLTPYHKDLALCFRALRLFDKADQPKPKPRPGKFLIYVDEKKGELYTVCEVRPPGRFAETEAHFPVLYFNIYSHETGATSSLIVPKGVVGE